MYYLRPRPEEIVVKKNREWHETVRHNESTNYFRPTQVIIGVHSPVTNFLNFFYSFVQYKSAYFCKVVHNSTVCFTQACFNVTKFGDIEMFTTT